jgi:zinc protease
MYREESLVMIGFLTVGMKDADRFPLEVLGSVLSGQSGRLFRDLRDIQALAYTLGCVHMAGPDTGCMVLYAATTRENIERTRKELLKEIKMVRDAPPGEDELRQAKSELINRRSIMMQSNSFFTFESAVAELCGLGYGSLYRYKDDIAAVTKEDLRRVAGKYLDPDKRAEILILSK